MSAGNLTAALHLVLDDKISAGLKIMTKQLDGLRDAGKQIGLGKLTTGLDELKRGIGSAKSMREVIVAIGSSAERSGQQIKRMAQDLAFAAKYHATLGAQDLRQRGQNVANKVGAIGGIAAGYSVMEPVHVYAEQQKTLGHIGITEKKSGADINTEIARLNKLFNQDALETGQSSTSIAEAYSDLVQRGIPASVIDQVIKAHSRAATAYNISAKDLGPAVAALLKNSEIPEDRLGIVLARVAYASKEGAFKVTDFSQQLPGITGRMNALGMKGEASASMSFAALETIMNNSSQPNQAAADFTDALVYLTSHSGDKSFARNGLDLPKILLDGKKNGVNPLDALLAEVSRITEGMEPLEAAIRLGPIFGNQQSGSAVLALIQHKDEFQKLRDELAGVTQDTADRDFASAFALADTKVKLLDEHLAQLNRRAGEGFMPIIEGINHILDRVGHGLDRLDQVMPGLGNAFLVTAGSMILLGGALGIIGAIWPAIVAGASLLAPIFKLLSMAISALDGALAFLVAGFEAIVTVSSVALAGIAVLAAGLVAAAVDIYDNWGNFKDFFAQIGFGIMEVLAGIADTLYGAFTLDIPTVLKGFREISAGVVDIFKGLYGVLQQLFTDVWGVIGNPVTAWLDSIKAVLDRIRLPGRAGNNPGDDTGLPGVGDNGVLAPVPVASTNVAIKIETEKGLRSSGSSPDPSVDVTHAAPLPPGRMMVPY